MRAKLPCVMPWREREREIEKNKAKNGGVGEKKWCIHVCFEFEETTHTSGSLKTETSFKTLSKLESFQNCPPIPLTISLEKRREKKRKDKKGRRKRRKCECMKERLE